jgi:hypothetical protein
MEKEKKHYFSVIGGKIEKEKEKYESLTLGLNQKRTTMLSE